MTWIDPYAMLATAEKLAGYEAGRGRPAGCDLRRATSTAYYAVFNQITRHAALAAITSATEADVTRAARWVTHANIASACRSVQHAAATQTTPKDERSRVDHLAGGAQAGIHPDLLGLAARFADLQVARHTDDYDNSYEPDKAATIGHVETARAALLCAWRLWRPNAQQTPRVQAHDQYERFLLLVYLGPRETKPR